MCATVGLLTAWGASTLPALSSDSTLIKGNLQTFQAYYQEVELPYQSSSNM